MRTTANGTTGHVADDPTEPTRDLDFSEFMNGFVTDAKGYFIAETQHLTLHATEKAAVLLGKVVRSVAVYVLLAAMVLFLNVALALYLGDLLRSLPLGFAIMGATHLLLLGGFLLWWSHGGRDRFLLDRINDLTRDDQ